MKRALMAAAGRLIVAACCLSLTACGRYADFTLPVLEAKDAAWPKLVLQPEPVLKRGETSDVLNPSVVEVNGELLNFYSAFDGRTWRTALTKSTDGVHWGPGEYVLSPDAKTWEGAYIAANGTDAYLNGKGFHWYVAGAANHTQIGFAETRRPVLSPGPRGSFDEVAVADPYVIRVGDSWYMYYLGQDRARRQQIGLARSQDGVVWEKLRTNPVLAMGEPGGMDDRGLGEPAVWQLGGWYWMLFTGRDAQENRSLGLARSADGVKWTRSKQVFRGDQPWDSKVLCDPAVLVQNGRVRVWFGGGDVASPDQNLHGQIGIGEMR
jgi:predicted GH43/DUF377 family glycosyl hydrolase